MRLGLGYQTRGAHELLLVGDRGEVPSPAQGDQPPSVIFAPRTAHSEKPAVFAGLIEQQLPNAPKLELFARRARPGWVTWGNEAPSVAEKAGDTGEGAAA